ncbi:MAG: hypothetical protein FWF06_08100 [Symbiobacteriaceae bacterium]|nr:hypothetical protein [Symbiobacteriaceae bacterium]
MSDNLVLGFGNPPSLSLLRLHQQALAGGMRLPYTYQPIQLEAPLVETSGTILRSPHILGCHFAESLPVGNCPWLDDVATGATYSGRINAVFKNRGKLVGEDTSQSGAMRALQHAGYRPQGTRVLLIGSAGAAQGLVQMLAEAGITQLLLLHSSSERLRGMAGTLKRDIPNLSLQVGSLHNEDLTQVLSAVQLLVIAMEPGDKQSRDSLPPHLSLPAGLFYLDLLSGAAPIWATQESVRYIPPLTLLLWQNVVCFRLWNHYDPPIAFLQEIGQ